MRYVASIGVLLLLVGCSDPAPSARCEPASSGAVDAVASGLTVQGGGGLSEAVIVDSDDGTDMWFLAADLEGEGLTGTEVAVFMINNPTVPTRIAPANVLANEFTDWGDAGENPDLMEVDGAAEAESCVSD